MALKGLFADQKNHNIDHFVPILDLIVTFIA